MMMDTDEWDFEKTLQHIYHSSKIKKAVSTASLVGIAACIIILFPPVQKAILTFAGTVIDLRSHSIESLQNRLFSLLSLAVLGLAALILLLCCLHSEKIAGILSEPKNERPIIFLGLGISLIALVFVSFFSYRYGRQWLTSDDASEMVLGKLLAEENVLVSRQWHYSTEIRLVYQTLFSMPLFKLFGSLDNWAFIRAATIFLNNALLLATYMFMTWQVNIRNKWICLSAIFLLAPLSRGYWDIVSFGGYYVFFIVQNFCCLGLFFRLVRSSPTNRRFRGEFILFSVLSLILGTQGIRSLLNIQIPLMLTGFVFYKFNRSSGGKTSVFLGLYSFILCCAGFIINWLLRFIYNFHIFENMRIDELREVFFTKLGQNIVSLFSFFGFTGGQPVLSARGITSILAVFFTLYFLKAMIAILRQNHANKDNQYKGGHHKSDFVPKQFIILYFFVSLFFNVFVFQIVEQDVTERYFIPFLILYVPLLALLFEKTEQKKPALTKIGILAAVFLFILTRSVLVFQDLSVHDKNSSRDGYISYLLEHNLNFGFASFWNANVSTELTNGKINIAGLEPQGLEPGNKFNIQGWLNPEAFYKKSYYKGESFLLLTKAEWDMARQTGRPFAEETPDYDDGEFIILRYPQAAIIHDTILDK
jgi:hypothetical protein